MILRRAIGCSSQLPESQTAVPARSCVHKDGAITHSTVMRSYSRTIRFIEAHHKLRMSLNTKRGGCYDGIRADTGSHIFNALKDGDAICLAVNPRITAGTVRGIFRAAKDFDAPVIMELAKSESDLSGGYTGLTPSDFSSMVHAEAKLVGTTSGRFMLTKLPLRRARLRSLMASGS